MASKDCNSDHGSVRTGKDTNGWPKGNCYIITNWNTGWPKGRESYGHGVAIVPVGTQSNQGCL